MTELEGDTGATPFLYTVSLTENDGVDYDIEVSYCTEAPLDAAYPAQPGQDYTTLDGAFNLAPRETSLLLEVDVRGDTDLEADETFALNVHQAIGAIIPELGIGTIVWLSFVVPAYF